MTGLMYLKGVSTLKLENDKCNSCGMCVTVCPHAVFSFQKKALIAYGDRCMECGACQQNCSAGAITVNAGVGCAAAVISGMFSNSAPSCGCGDDKKTVNCC